MWLKNLLSNIKLFFTIQEYQGSSEAFIKLYEQATNELDTEHCDMEEVLFILECLAALMRTQGDARLVKVLQTKYKLRTHNE